MKLYLASASPRRNMLLKKFGIDFQRIIPKEEEISKEGIKPKEFARRNAIIKMKSVLDEVDEGIIITADTIVVKNNEILEKPLDNRDASRMLEMLSGTNHFVFTAVVVFEKITKRMEVEIEKTKVFMRRLSKREIQEYIDSGEPLDAAGAYKIQELGGKFIERIDGCYYNVVGLPIVTLIKMLRKFDIEV